MAESTHTAAAPDTCAVVAAGGLGLRRVLEYIGIPYESFTLPS